MPRRSPVIPILALLTLGGGLVNLLGLLNPVWTRSPILHDLLPPEFHHLSRFLTLLLGFALIVSSINIYRRKRLAWYVVLVLAVFSFVFHLTKGFNFEQAFFPVLVAAVLVPNRRLFTVRSGTPGLKATALRLGLTVVVALGYGVLGFWLLDRRDFGLNFTLADAADRTVRLMLLMQEPDLVPHTRHARWFLDSLSLMTWTAIGYGLITLFRPVVYRLTVRPHEHRLAKEILRRHGRSSLDFFKLWPDKSIFLASSQNAFLAYRVGGGFAMVLGDPVGPEEEIEPAVRAFADLCQENDWGLAFHQALPDFIPIYRRLGFRKLKIGDEAVVDLTRFSLEGKAMKRIRNAVHKLESEGFRVVYHGAPLPPQVLETARRVSDEWLTIAGRRERAFTLGLFEADYVRSTPLLALMDGRGEMQAFANIIPSGRPGEGTIDLMRHRPTAPNGCMEQLFVALFEHFRERGFTSFNLGMAPMAGFQESETPSPEERAIHFFFQRLNALFSYRGLRQFKAKFATGWEPRYLVYRNVLALPQVAVALSRVSEIRGRRAGGDDRDPDRPGRAGGGPVAWWRALSGAVRRAAWLRPAAGWLVAAACLAWVFHDVNVRDALRRATTIPWVWWLPAVALDILSYLAQGWRWRLLLPPAGAPGILRTTQAVYAGLFTNEILPVRVGELVRAHLVHRWRGAPYPSVFSSMLVERLFDGIWLAAGIGVVAMLVPLPHDLLVAGDVLGAIALAGAALFAFTVWRTRRRRREAVSGAGAAGAAPGGPEAAASPRSAAPTASESTFPAPAPTGRLARFWRRLACEMESLGPGGRIYGAFLVSLFIPLLQALAFWLLMRGYGFPLSLWSGIAVLLIVHLGTALPNAPGNVGSYQFFCVVGLAFFGIDKAAATGFSVAAFIILTIPLWVLGFAALSRSGTSLKAIRAEIAGVVAGRGERPGAPATRR